MSNRNNVFPWLISRETSWTKGDASYLRSQLGIKNRVACEKLNFSKFRYVVVICSKYTTLKFWLCQLNGILRKYHSKSEWYWHSHSEAAWRSNLLDVIRQIWPETPTDIKKSHNLKMSTEHLYFFECITWCVSECSFEWANKKWGFSHQTKIDNRAYVF